MRAHYKHKHKLLGLKPIEFQLHLRLKPFPAPTACFQSPNPLTVKAESDSEGKYFRHGKQNAALVSREYSKRWLEVYHNTTNDWFLQQRRGKHHSHQGQEALLGDQTCSSHMTRAESEAPRVSVEWLQLHDRIWQPTTGPTCHIHFLIFHYGHINWAF